MVLVNERPMYGVYGDDLYKKKLACDFSRGKLRGMFAPVSKTSSKDSLSRNFVRNKKKYPRTLIVFLIDVKQNRSSIKLWFNSGLGMIESQRTVTVKLNLPVRK